MFDKILVVCVGNICRSPTAERLLRQQLPAKQVDSAGIAALVDHAAENKAFKVAQQHQLNLSEHKARQLTAEMCQQYDLILAMEKGHIEHIHQLSPASRGKVMLLGHWLDGKEIEDPYKRSEEMYQHVFTLINQACESWQTKLLEG